MTLAGRWRRELKMADPYRAQEPPQTRDPLRSQVPSWPNPIESRWSAAARMADERKALAASSAECQPCAACHIAAFVIRSGSAAGSRTRAKRRMSGSGTCTARVRCLRRRSQWHDENPSHARLRPPIHQRFVNCLEPCDARMRRRPTNCNERAPDA